MPMFILNMEWCHGYQIECYKELSDWVECKKVLSDWVKELYDRLRAIRCYLTGVRKKLSDWVEGNKELNWSYLTG